MKTCRILIKNQMYHFLRKIIFALKEHVLFLIYFVSHLCVKQYILLNYIVERSE